MRHVSTACLLVLVVALGGCATRQPITGQEISGPDRKLSTFAYIEEGSLVTLIVGTKAARYREEADYIPLEIALANRGLRVLSLSREAFELRDADGNRYPLAGPEELIEGYAELDFDRAYAELGQITYAKFAAKQRYPANFSPTRTGGRIVRDRVNLPKHGYIIDYLYFPRPPGGIIGHEFELFLDSPELEDPVFVTFEVK